MLEIQENVPLSKHSTFKIGGPAKYFVVAKTKEDLIEAVNFAKSKNLPFFILGGGSNVLFRDEGYGGVIVKFSDFGFRISDFGMSFRGGFLLSQAINESIKCGYTGLEWAVGIPGTVAGCVAGNCGAYGSSISDSVASVAVMDSEGGIKKYSNEQCNFSYRESKFKNPDSKEIILEIEVNLEKSTPEKCKEKFLNILETRKNKKMPTQPSSGCIFKNIILDNLPNKEEFLKLIPQEKIKGGKFPVAWLIEDCGLKGKQIGGAKIAGEHCNFIVNMGGAKASEVIELANLCEKKVKEKFNINLEKETLIV